MRKINNTELLLGFEWATSASEIRALFQELGIEYLAWQLRTGEQLHTWDEMPGGFLEHYYGTQTDQPCAIAEAIRQNRNDFTFAEARYRFTDRPGAQKAEKIWRAFGIRDGAVFTSEIGGSRAITALCASTDMERIIRGREAVLAVGAYRLHQLLAGNPDLSPISRDLIDLPAEQLEAMRLRIDHPELAFDEQARQLGISRKELEESHSRIATRFGLTSHYTGAGCREAGYPEAAQHPDRVDLYIGGRVRILRELRGFGQQALARRSGMDGWTLRACEQGLQPFTISQLVTLATLLRVPITRFWSGFKVEQGRGNR